MDVDVFRKAAAFSGKSLFGLPGGPAAHPQHIPAVGRCEPALSSWASRFKVYAELHAHIDFFPEGLRLKQRSVLGGFVL